MEYSEKEIQKRISAHLFNHNLDLVFTETLGAENAFAAVARQLLERSWDNAVDKLLLQSYLALAHDQSAISSFENAAQGEVARTREFAFDAIARLFRDKWYAENTQFSEIALKGLGPKKVRFVDFQQLHVRTIRFRWRSQLLLRFLALNHLITTKCSMLWTKLKRVWKHALSDAK